MRKIKSNANYILEQTESSLIGFMFLMRELLGMFLKPLGFYWIGFLDDCGSYRKQSYQFARMEANKLKEAPFFILNVDQSVIWTKVQKDGKYRLPRDTFLNRRC